jgi:hypothetical protein
MICIRGSNEELWQVPESPDQSKHDTGSRKTQAFGQARKGIAAPTDFFARLNGPG